MGIGIPKRWYPLTNIEALCEAMEESYSSGGTPKALTGSHFNLPFKLEIAIYKVSSQTRFRRGMYIPLLTA
jgi:hypothetical protein